jgi:predicted ATPase/DNA-binding XRE family transcriptional regulator
VATGDASTTFGDLLRNYRRLAELTQEELAERAGLSVRSISDLERGGAHTPRRDTVNLIVRALDLEPADRALIESTLQRRRGPRDQPNDTIEHGTTPAAHPASNLTRQLTSFVGRERELQDLQHDLDQTPLLTLVGAGGVGKTRLALELAGIQLAASHHEVWLVELAGVADPALVPAAVAGVLGVSEHAGQPIEQVLSNAIRARHLLLVLDNCEHVLNSCAGLVDTLLRHCANLRVLATSREPLGVAGEVTRIVPPLSLPDRSAATDMLASTAVQLFVERAKAVQTELRVDDETGPLLASICRRLDGIPLALELAAARLGGLSIYQLSEHLESNLGLLASRSRIGMSHHHTLRATLQWSLDLLDEQERRLFRRLAVFAGGWSVSLAEEVCAALADGEPADMLDLLSRLVDKSMVVLEVRAQASRYRMLEPVRQYALELLESSGELATYRARHAAALLELAEEGEAHLSGSLEVASLDRLEVEHANCRAALGWLVGQQDGSGALRLATVLWRFWERRGFQREGRAWLEQALALSSGLEGPLDARGRALNALANMHWAAGDMDAAMPLAEEALRASRDSPRGTAWAYINLGMVAYYQADAERAIGYLEESLSPGQTAGDMPLLSLALSCLGRVLLWAHGPSDPRAVVCLEESLAVAQRAESRHAISQALGGLAELAARRGDLDVAVGRWRDALTLRWELRDQRGIATSIERLAQLAAALGEVQRAAWLWGAAEACRDSIGLRFRHDEALDHARLVATAAASSSRTDFDANWTAGAQATLDHVVATALTAAPQKRSSSTTGSFN